MNSAVYTTSACYTTTVHAVGIAPRIAATQAAPLLLAWWLRVVARLQMGTGASLSNLLSMQRRKGG